MIRAPGHRRANVVLLGALLLALAACAEPETEIKPSADDAVYTASGRYPAAHSGILIAQNAALTEGRQVCERQGKHFRPLASVAGEDSATGEAVYAVRFRCFVRPGASTPIIAPSPPRDMPPDRPM